MPGTSRFFQYIRRVTFGTAAISTAFLAMVFVFERTAHAQGFVKVTPFGSHDGELCSDDRAMMFEDPTGVRILYDPGRRVDENDQRLGDVDVMLLSHGHVDHLGDRRPGPPGSGTCGAPAFGAANPLSNFASIAAAKNAASFLISSEMDTFIARKIQDILGTPTELCVARDRNDDTIVPRTSPCVARVHPGGSLVVRRGGAGAGVRIASVQATHPNGIPAVFIDAPGVAPGTSGYGGIAGGYMLQFSNGLTAYLTGDTGLFTDMEMLAKFYHPKLVVMNIGDVGTLGPTEAAFAIQHLIKGRPTVMPSHLYEQATERGSVRPGSRLETFIGSVHGFADVVVSLSGVTRSFNRGGRCVDCE
jgi:L-ascorbate metabolism protein UlaG (beta-lactamase superfamily)